MLLFIKAKSDLVALDFHLIQCRFVKVMGLKRLMIEVEKELWNHPNITLSEECIDLKEASARMGKF